MKEEKKAAAVGENRKPEEDAFAKRTGMSVDSFQKMISDADEKIPGRLGMSVEDFKTITVGEQ